MKQQFSASLRLKQWRYCVLDWRFWNSDGKRCVPSEEAVRSCFHQLIPAWWLWWKSTGGAAVECGFILKICVLKTLQCVSDSGIWFADFWRWSFRVLKTRGFGPCFWALGAATFLINEGEMISLQLCHKSPLVGTSWAKSFSLYPARRGCALLLPLERGRMHLTMQYIREGSMLITGHMLDFRVQRRISNVVPGLWFLAWSDYRGLILQTFFLPQLCRGNTVWLHFQFTRFLFDEMATCYHTVSGAQWRRLLIVLSYLI